MEYFSIKEVEKKLGIDQDQLGFYVEIFEEHLDCVFSHDFKEIFFTNGDIELMKQIHDMSEVLGMTSEEISKSLSNLLTPGEFKKILDQGENEAAELSRIAIKKNNIPQLPVDRKLLNIVKTQKKMTGIFRNKFQKLKSLEEKVETLASMSYVKEQLKQRSKMIADLARDWIDFEKNLNEGVEISLESKKTISILEKKIAEISREFIKVKTKNVSMNETLKKAELEIASMSERLLILERNFHSSSRNFSSTVAGDIEVSLPKIPQKKTFSGEVIETRSTNPPDSEKAFNHSQLAGLNEWIQRLGKN
ncbi:MerR family transcriptional regulator [Candidatus Riflebacteria bacterium]